MTSHGQWDETGPPLTLSPSYSSGWVTSCTYCVCDCHGVRYVSSCVCRVNPPSPCSRVVCPCRVSCVTHEGGPATDWHCGRMTDYDSDHGPGNTCRGLSTWQWRLCHGNVFAAAVTLSWTFCWWDCDSDALGLDYDWHFYWSCRTTYNNHNGAYTGTWQALLLELPYDLQQAQWGLHRDMTGTSTGAAVRPTTSTMRLTQGHDWHFYWSCRTTYNNHNGAYTGTWQALLLELPYDLQQAQWGLHRDMTGTSTGAAVRPTTSTMRLTQGHDWHFYWSCRTTYNNHNGAYTGTWQALLLELPYDLQQSQWGLHRDMTGTSTGAAVRPTTSTMRLTQGHDWHFYWSCRTTYNNHNGAYTGTWLALLLELP